MGIPSESLSVEPQRILQWRPRTRPKGRCNILPLLRAVPFSTDKTVIAGRSNYAGPQKGRC
jgi:hypothetical protein